MCDHSMEHCEECIKYKKKVQRMKSKIQKYETILKDLMEDSDDEEDEIIVERNVHGETNKTVSGKLGDSYYIVDNGKNLEELNKSEYDAIKSQDDLYKYNKAKNAATKAGTVWGWTIGILGLGKVAFGAF